MIMKIVEIKILIEKNKTIESSKTLILTMIISSAELVKLHQIMHVQGRLDPKSPYFQKKKAKPLMLRITQSKHLVKNIVFLYLKSDKN